jgi:hypothetical protein
MHIFLDHLSASLVTATILVAVAALGLSAQEDGVAAVSDYALRQQVESFGATVQTDLASLSTPVSLDATGGTFTFRARLTPHDTTQHLVRYVREDAGERGGAPVYRIGRFVDGVRRGGSSDVVAGWTVVAQSAAGLPASTPSDVARVYVSIDPVAPFGADSTLPAAPWESTVTPLILHYDTF